MSFSISFAIFLTGYWVHDLLHYRPSFVQHWKWGRWRWVALSPFLSSRRVANCSLRRKMQCNCEILLWCVNCEIWRRFPHGRGAWNSALLCGIQVARRLTIYLRTWSRPLVPSSVLSQDTKEFVWRILCTYPDRSWILKIASKFRKGKSILDLL